MSILDFGGGVNRLICRNLKRPQTLDQQRAEKWVFFKGVWTVWKMK